jgi:flagellar basal-body rod modification protein FlgD
MSTIGSITNTAAGTAQSTSATKSLGKDDFLKMLLAQLKNQDPLNPLDGTDFAAQLAQFSSLEQLTNMSTELSTLGLYQMTASNVQAVGLIGKEVTARGDNTVKAAGAPVSLSYELPADASTVSVKIYNEAGDLVKTIDGGTQNDGVNSVTWNCSDAPAGNYTFDVDAKDAGGNAITATTITSGQVTAVHFKDNAIMLTVNGRDIAFSDIVSVKNTTQL